LGKEKDKATASRKGGFWGFLRQIVILNSKRKEWRGKRGRRGRGSLSFDARPRRKKNRPSLKKKNRLHFILIRNKGKKKEGKAMLLSVRGGKGEDLGGGICLFTYLGKGGKRIWCLI